MGNPDLGTPPHIVRELVTSAVDPRHHRYSASRGIHGLREAIAAHYDTRYGLTLDAESEVVVTIGAKEGIAHLMLAILDQGDTVIVPQPAYPIHTYSVVFAGGQVRTVPLRDAGQGQVDGDALLRELGRAIAESVPRPKALIFSFLYNPTTLIAEHALLERMVELCHRERLLMVHDFAYADFGFDTVPTSLLQIPGAREIGVEFYSMSKSYCMAGWRVGFCVGNAAMVGALTRVKSYLDYGIFQPIQIAAAYASAADGVRARGARHLPLAPRRAGRDRRAGWRAVAEGDDVRVGADPGAVAWARLGGVRAAVAAGDGGGGLAGGGVRRGRRGLHTLRADRVGSAHARGGASHRGVAAGLGGAQRPIQNPAAKPTPRATIENARASSHQRSRLVCSAMAQRP